MLDRIGQRFRRAVDIYAQANHIPVMRFHQGSLARRSRWKSAIKSCEIARIAGDRMYPWLRAQRTTPASIMSAVPVQPHSLSAALATVPSNRCSNRAVAPGTEETHEPGLPNASAPGPGRCSCRDHHGPVLCTSLSQQGSDVFTATVECDESARVQSQAADRGGIPAHAGLRCDGSSRPSSAFT